jgi:hypothetical protein
MTIPLKLGLSRPESHNAPKNDATHVEHYPNFQWAHHSIYDPNELPRDLDKVTEFLNKARFNVTGAIFPSSRFRDFCAEYRRSVRKAEATNQLLYELGTLREQGRILYWYAVEQGRVNLKSEDVLQPLPNICYASHSKLLKQDSQAKLSELHNVYMDADGKNGIAPNLFLRFGDCPFPPTEHENKTFNNGVFGVRAIHQLTNIQKDKDHEDNRRIEAISGCLVNGVLNLYGLYAASTSSPTTYRAVQL